MQYLQEFSQLPVLHVLLDGICRLSGGDFVFLARAFWNLFTESHYSSLSRTDIIYLADHVDNIGRGVQRDVVPHTHVGRVHFVSREYAVAVRVGLTCALDDHVHLVGEAAIAGGRNVRHNKHS